MARTARSGAGTDPAHRSRSNRGAARTRGPVALDAVAAPFVQALQPWSVPPSRSVDALRVVYAIWRKPWMSVNADTFVHDVLQRCDVVNVCADAPARYPELVPEELAGVDAVLLPSEPWEFDESQRAELAARRTFGNAQLVLCDGRDFCWHGTRMVGGLQRASLQLRALDARRRGG